MCLDLGYTPCHCRPQSSHLQNRHSLPRALGYISSESETGVQSRHPSEPIMQPHLRFKETQTLSPLKANKLSVNPEP